MILYQSHSVQLRLCDLAPVVVPNLTTKHNNNYSLHSVPFRPLIAPLLPLLHFPVCTRAQGGIRVLYLHSHTLTW